MTEPASISAGAEAGIHRQWFEPTAEADSAGSRIPIVLLHEGLGSISTWGSFPQALADAAKRSVLAYDRAGYGLSGPKPGPWPPTFMHHEAVKLAELLVEERTERAILVGHSDGATISLLYPSQMGPGDPEIVAIVSLSGHVLVEELNVEAIVELRRTYHDQLAHSLARHHRRANALFESWSEVWVSDRFRRWTIDEELDSVSCPVLAAQGSADGYGTAIQLERLAAAVVGPVETVELPGVDHWPHKEARSEVLGLITEFVDRMA